MLGNHIHRIASHDDLTTEGSSLQSCSGSCAGELQDRYTDVDDQIHEIVLIDVLERSHGLVFPLQLYLGIG